MFFSKPILSFLLLVLLVSISTVHGDDTTGTDESCSAELAAYHACFANNQDVCDSECANVEIKELNFRPRDIISMMTNPNFICNWFTENYCNIQRCCGPCDDEAGVYLSCVAADNAEDSACSFACTSGGGRSSVGGAMWMAMGIAVVAGYGLV